MVVYGAANSRALAEKVEDVQFDEEDVTDEADHQVILKTTKNKIIPFDLPTIYGTPGYDLDSVTRRPARDGLF